MFIRTQTNGDRTYLLLVENERVDGRLVQRVLYRLGRLDQLQASGQLDGLVEMSDGSFLVSSWSGRGIYRVDAASKSTLVVRDLESPASIAYDAKRKQLLIPLMKPNKLRIEQYPPERQG